MRGRARAAETLARDLIGRGADDAEAHRLLAHALEAIAADGDARALAEAAREHELAERIEPGDLEDSERLALLYAERFDDPGKAVLVLDQLVQSALGSPRKLAQAHLVRFRYFTARNLPDRAEAEVDRAVKADPSSVEARLAAAESAIRRGDTATARQHLRAVAPSARDDLRVKLIEGLIELGEQRPDDALQSWRAGLLMTGGHNIDLTWRLAHILLELGRTREAEPLVSQYRRLVGGDQPDPRYRYLHGFALLKRHRFAEAIAELDGIRFQVDKPLQPHLHYLLGQCDEATRDLPKALDDYRQSADASRRWNAPWLAIARLQVDGRPDEAIATLQRGLALMPGDARMLAALAQIYWRQQVRLPRERRSWSRFERLMDQARSRAPDSVELALVQADYLVAVGKGEEALGLLGAAARRNSKSAMLWLAWANGLNRMGQPARALETLDRAAVAVGDDADLIVTRASILVGQGHARDARSSLTDGLGRIPDDRKPTVWKALGELAVGQGDQALARRVYQQWAALRPDEPEPRLALVDLGRASDDEPALRAAIDGLKDVGGPRGHYGRLARVEQLLRDRPGISPDAARGDEAAALLRDVAKAGGSRDAGGAALTLASAAGADPRWVGLADAYLAAARKEHPEAFDLLQKQAFLRHIQHRHEDELKLYDAMLAQRPSDFLFLNNMAWTLSEDLGRPEEGLRRANEALKRVGREPHLLDTRGVIEIRLGQLDEAIEDLEEATGTLPAGPVYFHLARAYRTKGRTEDFRAYRDRARQVGLRPEQLQESERGDWAAIMNE